jgi:hypothetical protein
MLSLLAHSTLYGSSSLKNGVNFIVSESDVISESILPFLGKIFLLITSLMLFGTQLSVFGSTSRIMSENLCIFSVKAFPTKNLGVYFYIFLWLQILIGTLILLMGIGEPLKLITISAVLNAVAMFIYTALVLWLNKTNLYKQIQPNLFRTAVLILAFLLYGGFGVYFLVQSW